jgi:hypothetical protein
MKFTDQIVQLHKIGASPEVIANALDMDEAMVLACLETHAPGFKVAKAQIDPTRATKDQMLDIIVSLAKNSPNEFVQLNAAKFARDDLMGRRDEHLANQQQEAAICVLLRERAANIEASRRAFLTRGSSPVIDVAAA